MKPEPVADRNEALRVCLDQLFATAGYTITLYRCLKEDGLGDWREVEGFSPLHKAMKLLKPAHAENYTLQYIVFGMEGDVEDKKVCYDKLVNQPGGKEVLSVYYVNLEIFGAACKHWGLPRLSEAVTVDSTSRPLASWPVPQWSTPRQAP
jgi:hypothetical protein